MKTIDITEMEGGAALRMKTRCGWCVHRADCPDRKDTEGSRDVLDACGRWALDTPTCRNCAKGASHQCTAGVLIDYWGCPDWVRKDDEEVNE